MHRSVENLALTWSSIETLCAPLGEDEWKHPTGCPGWTVQDNLAHIVDYESRALGRPAPGAPPASAEHVRNELGTANEAGVAARRARPGAEVLAEFREVTAERLAQLRALDDEALAREVPTPVGTKTLAESLNIRVMDIWMHEQDMRRALGRPGHEDGPACEEAVGYFLQFLPYVVAKRANAPDGTAVRFVVGAMEPVGVAVSGGRGRLDGSAARGPSDVELRMPLPTFAALVGGRSDAPDDVELGGDVELGRRIVAGLGFLP